MANTAHLFRRQSSRDLVPSSYHRTIDNLELKVRTKCYEMLIFMLLYRVQTLANFFQSIHIYIPTYCSAFQIFANIQYSLNTSW